MFNIAWFILAFLFVAIGFMALHEDSLLAMGLCFASAFTYIGIAIILETIEFLHTKLNYMTSCMNAICDRLDKLERKDK